MRCKRMLSINVYYFDSSTRFFNIFNIFMYSIFHETVISWISYCVIWPIAQITHNPLRIIKLVCFVSVGYVSFMSANSYSPGPFVSLQLYMFVNACLTCKVASFRFVLSVVFYSLYLDMSSVRFVEIDNMPLLFIFTDPLYVRPIMADTVVMIISPFHNLSGESFSVEFGFSIIPQFHPIFLSDTQRDSSLSTLHQDACNIWNPTPSLHISIRALDSDQHVRGRIRGFCRHMACPRSEQGPKSNVVSIFNCYRRPEFYESRKYGYEFEAIPQDLKRLKFRLRYSLRFWRSFGSDHSSSTGIFLSSLFRVCFGSFHLWESSFPEYPTLWYTFTLHIGFHFIHLPLESDKCTVRHIFNEIMIGLSRIHIQESWPHWKYDYIYEFLSSFHESFISDSSEYELKVGGHCDFCDFRLRISFFSDSIGRNFSFTSHFLRHRFSNLCRGSYFNTNSRLMNFLNSLPKLSHPIHISFHIFLLCVIFPSCSLALYIYTVFPIALL